MLACLEAARGGGAQEWAQLRDRVVRELFGIQIPLAFVFGARGVLVGLVLDILC